MLSAWLSFSGCFSYLAYLSAEEDMNEESFLRGEVSHSTKSCEFKQIDLKDLAKKKPTHPKPNKQLEVFTGKGMTPSQK